MIKVSGLKPQKLSPLYQVAAKGDLDIEKSLRNIVVDPIFTPLSNAKPGKINDGSNDLTKDDITQLLFSTLDDQINLPSEQTLKEILSQTLISYNKNTTLSINDMFTTQSAKAENMPEPSPTVLYTAGSDVIPACKKFLANAVSYDMLFASFALSFRVQTLGVYCLTSSVFDDFKAYLKQEIANITPGLDATAVNLFHQFDTLNLNELTESIALRNTQDQNVESLCFARLFVTLLMKFLSTQSPDQAGLFPFSLQELLVPRSIVFVNIEKHAHSGAKRVAEEWQIINQSVMLNKNVNMISNNQINKLTTVVRRSANSAKLVANMAKQKDKATRAANMKFRTKELTAADITRTIQRLIAHMHNVNKSQNSYKSVKMSFARPNRRDPDNFNLMGKVVSTKFKPDIHLYIDTSGSVSEEHYQDAVKTCIKLARKLNVNLYFNSFSHRLSQCSLLHTKDKSPAQVFAEFVKIPKVSGGTDYEQIWHYINRSKQRKRELSIIMTDFEYTSPNHFVQHPKNLYYLPLSHMNMHNMACDAKYFCKSTLHIEPNIRKHVMF